MTKITEVDEMQTIVEKAGECWHVSSDDNSIQCICGLYIHDSITCDNPSPTDLNELFRLAEKLEVVDLHFEIHSKGCWLGDVDAPTPADALREALYQAVKES